MNSTTDPASKESQLAWDPKLTERFRESHFGIRILQSLTVVYKDAIRRGLEVGEVYVSNYASGFSRVEFVIRLGDKPKIWGKHIEGMDIYVLVLLAPQACPDATVLGASLRQLAWHERGRSLLKHPHRMTGGLICTNIDFRHVLERNPWALIPSAIQAASTVSVGYVQVMIDNMKELKKEVPYPWNLTIG